MMANAWASPMTKGPLYPNLRKLQAVGLAGHGNQTYGGKRLKGCPRPPSAKHVAQTGGNTRI